MFHNNIIKKNSETLNKRNLLKICLQITDSTDLLLYIGSYDKWFCINDDKSLQILLCKAPEEKTTFQKILTG